MTAHMEAGRFCSKHCSCVYSSKLIKTHHCNFNVKRASYGTWICRFCGAILETRSKLKEHINELHKEEYEIWKQNGCSWNKGKTKETDERIANSALKYSENYKSGKFTIKPRQVREDVKEKLSLARSKIIEEKQRWWIS